jgi:hypothetical protein
MKILGHRGYWKTVYEQNTLTAFRKSFDLGYGVETDFRDLNGRLVINHNIPTSESMLADRLFEIMNSVDSNLPLAVNIKSDGLQDLLLASINKFKITNYFLFDMSVPDAVISIKRGLRVFTRQSDVEKNPAFYEQADGVWIDAFYSDDWIDEGIIKTHLSAGKSVCLVSPEIHKRSHRKIWGKLKSNRLCDNTNLLLCTDLPDEASVYFHL